MGPLGPVTRRGTMAFHDHYQIDEKTGFLTPKPDSRNKNGFTAEQKVLWLEAYKECANLAKASAAVGINQYTVQDHLKGDEKFHQAYKETIAYFNSNVEETLYHAAVKSKNVTAMFGWLRAHYPELYKDGYTEKGPNKDERLANLLKNLKDELKEDKKGS